MKAPDAMIDAAAQAVLARLPGLARLAAALLTARGFAVYLIAVLLAQGLIRALAFPGTGGDDGEQIVFAQYLAIGYFPRNPPLYAWLVHAAQTVFGVSVLAVAVVKFVAIGLTSALLFACGRRLYRDDRLAVLAALAPLATFLVFWDAVTGLSNSVLVMLPCALGFYILLRIYEAPCAGWYLAFGVVAGLGFLSKYGYGLFLASLLAATACDRTGRARLLRLESLLALAAGAAIVAPYLLWFIDKRSATMSTDMTVGIVPGFGFLLSAAFGATAPLWVLLPLFFPQILRRTTPGEGREIGEAPQALRRVLGFHLAFALLLLAVTGAVSGLKTRVYYMSILILGPLYVFTRVQAAAWREAATLVFALVVAAIPVGAALGLAGQALFEPFFCKKCERQLPYDDWSRQLRAAGFTRGTIVADWWPNPLAGNFKIRFPDSRMVTVKHPYAIAPDSAAPGSCLLLWSAPERRTTVIGFANATLGAGIDTGLAGAGVTAPVRFTGGKHPKTVHYLLLKDGAGRCR